MVDEHSLFTNSIELVNKEKGADSVSFFENQVEYFIAKKADEAGKEKVRKKFRWMFDRITSDRAKEYAHQWYEDAMQELG